MKNRGASDGGGRPTPGDLALAHTKRSEGSEPTRRSEGEVCSELHALITSKIVNMNTARTCLPKGSRTTTGGRGRVKAPEMQRLTKY